MRRTVAAAGLMLVVAGPAEAQSQNAARPEGARLFDHCYACHSLDPAETGLPGPSLAGVLDRPAAALTEFDYSPAMRRAAAAGLVWDAETLDAYIADPEAVVPGTWMGFVGLSDAAERAALVEYIIGAVD